MSRPKIDARPTRVSDVLRSWDVLPVADLEMLFGAGPPLVLAPHPDDESIGCGGIIAGCCAQGPPPTVVVVTDGAASHPGSRRWPPEALRDLRESEAREAVRRLGLPGDRIRFLRLADAAAPHGGEAFDGAVDEVCRVVMSSRCGAVLATWSHDPHCDHKAVAKMARAVACRTGVPHYAYPVW
ncbi:MAG TPA: PIG-L family deacetylase, partial [Acetobacteraceae bacterium]|nr:PIG-L family deacetylase [Acetobacteraceae bacterium]